MKYAICGLALLTACNCTPDQGTSGGLSATSTSGTSSGTGTAGPGTTGGTTSGTASGTTGGTTGTSTGALPAVEPPLGNLWIVAASDNLIIQDAGIRVVPVDGGSVAASQYNCPAACLDFSVNNLIALGFGDGGRATLTLEFDGGAPNNQQPIDFDAGTPSVTFTNTTLPPFTWPGYGTVSITLDDGSDGGTTLSWQVMTDTNDPNSPSVPNVTVTDKRTATLALTWTAPDPTGDSPIIGYETAYFPQAVYAGFPLALDELNYPYWSPMDQFGDAGTTAILTVPTLNQYYVFVRAIDSVENRSPIPCADTNLACDGGASLTPDIDDTNTNPNAWNVVTLTNMNPNADFGYILRTGDFNGDGKDDLVIAAPHRYDNNVPGEVFILYGRTDLSSVTFPADLVRISLTPAGTATDQFGMAIAVADLNHDGFADMIVGAPLFDGGQGRVDIYYGSDAGLATVAATTLNGNPNDFNLFGEGIATADVNGDGIPDLLVGAPFTASATTRSGAVYVFFGPDGGDWSGPNRTFLDANSAITGKPGDLLGAHWGMVNLGDTLDGGHDDVALGAPGGGAAIDGTGLDGGGPGSEYGFRGADITANTSLTTAKAYFTTIGRVGGDCLPGVDGWDSIDPSDPTTYPGMFFSCYGVDAIGDQHFSGGVLPDLVIGSTWYSRLYFYQMTPDGPLDAGVGNGGTGYTDPTWTFANHSGALGWSIAAGDLNQDGKLDLMTGEDGDQQPEVYFFLNNGTNIPFPTANGVGAQSGGIVGVDGGFFGYGMTFGNFQGPGLIDFAISDDFPPTVSNYVNIYY